MYKENKWYKVFYNQKLFDGSYVLSFQYAMNEQIKQYEDYYKSNNTYVKTEKWEVK